MAPKFVFASTAIALATFVGGAAQALTDYTYVDTAAGIYAEGNYTIGSTPITLRPDDAWGSYAAPSGSGDFEIFNGAPTPGVRAWYATENLVEGDTYAVKAVLVNNYAISAPVFQLSVDGVDVGPAQTLNGPFGADYNDASVPGPWQTLSFAFTALTSGPSVVALTDTNIVRSGNDFSLASVSVPEPTTWALMLIGLGGMGASLRARRRGLTATA